MKRLDRIRVRLLRDLKGLAPRNEEEPKAPKPPRVHAAVEEFLVTQPRGDGGVTPAMKQAKRFSQLSAPRQALVRLLQSVNFGYLEGLEVRSGEPVFNPAPTVFVEVKLDAGNEPRPEMDLTDFELGNEVIRLVEQLDELGDGNIERIDVRYGIPRRALIERPIQGVRR